MSKKSSKQIQTDIIDKMDNGKKMKQEKILSSHHHNLIC